MDLLDDLKRYVARLDPADKAKVDALTAPVRKALWLPDPRNKPQCQAYYSKADLLLYGGSPGGGKALDINTPIPTPSGWSTIGALTVGDVIFDDKGSRTRVTACSPVMIGRPCFLVTFSDGTEIIADGEHGWLTTTRSERIALFHRTDAWREQRRSYRVRRGKGKRPDLAARNSATRHATLPPPTAGSIRTTTQIAATLLGIDGRLNHSVPLANPIECDSFEPPIDPYILGAWLGDGSSYKGEITTADAEVLSAFHDAGYETSQRSAITYGVYGLVRRLRLNHLLANKHIPQAYLRASVEQRLALLCGLMDTDGHADLRGRCEFTTTSEQLAFGAHELIATLGIKATICVGRATLKGRDCGAKYRLVFVSPLPVFRLQRKLERQKTADLRPTTNRRYIVSVEPIESVPVKCISVDSPSRLYLASKSFIPTHNSDLLLGTAITKHTRSAIFRRQANELGDVAERLLEIVGSRDGWNGQEKTLHRANGQVIDLGHLEKPGSEFSWQGGLGHDFIGFDEGSLFQCAKVRFVLGWLRSTKLGQRCQAAIASNPPVGVDGEWLVEWFAPWLDPLFPKPARSGELRWAVTARDPESSTVWLPDNRAIVFIGERDWRHATPDEIAAGGDAVITPQSRTFIPAKLADNPYLANTGYLAKLQGLPEPLRTRMLSGDFLGVREDDAAQVIPMAWIEAAQARWTSVPPWAPMTAVGVDVAQGGDDYTVIAARHGGWFAPLIRRSGKETREGADVAALVVRARRDACPVVVDAGGGFGTEAVAALERNGIVCVGYLGLRPSLAHTRDGKLKFANKRAESWWRMREELDPSQQGGSCIALPPGAKLKADLASPRYELLARGLKIEDKDDIKKRLGRSPDDGDAVVMCLAEGAAAAGRIIRGQSRQARPDHANVGHGNIKERIGL